MGFETETDLCWHGEQGGDAKGDSGGDWAVIKPEADPGHDDQHAGGDIDGEEVVGELPLEHQHHLEAAVGPGVSDGVAVSCLELLQLESWQVEILDDLDRVHLLPDVYEIRCCPAICDDYTIKVSIQSWRLNLQLAILSSHVWRSRG